MPKETPIAIRLPLATKTALTRTANEEIRSVSSLAEKILTDWLVEKGKLKLKGQGK